MVDIILKWAPLILCIINFFILLYILFLSREIDLNYINLSKKFREFKKESKVGIKIKKNTIKKKSNVSKKKK